MPSSRAAPPLDAYVLHSYDWSESSLIVDLFTRSQGRVVVVAKGAKRPTSNFRPLLLPFHALTVWHSRAAADAQGEVWNLRAVEWGGGAPLPGPVLISGFYLNELLLKGLARQDPHPTLFDAYADTLAALAAVRVTTETRRDAERDTDRDSDRTTERTEERDTGNDPEAEAVALRAFELVLLRELGLLPELDTLTASAAALVPTLRYTLRPEAGMAIDSEGATGTTWVALQAALLHGSLAALRQACAADPHALRAPLRNLVHYHLATPQLRTRRVSQQMQRLLNSPGRPLR